MKKIAVVFLSLIMLSALAGSAFATPAAVVENPVFIFESVPEGSHISHEFIIKNTGSSPLNILNVAPP